MRYRIHPKTGDKVSEIGFGTAYFYEVGMEEGIRILRRAFEGGINYFDLATSDIATFTILREALHDVRKGFRPILRRLFKKYWTMQM